MMPHKRTIIKQASASAKYTDTLAIASLLLSATLWGVFWYPLRLLEQAGLHGLWTTLLIYTGAMIMLVPLLWGRLAEFSRAPWLLFGIALSSGWCNTTFILAMLEGNVMRVLLLFYLSPLWATLLAWLLLKERLRRSEIVVLLLAMSGAVVMLWEPALGLPWPQGRADWLALSSGLTFALVNFFVRKTQAVSIQVKTVTAWLGVLLLAGSAILITNQGLGQAQPGAITAALLFGAFGMLVMTVTVQYGVTYMPLHRSAVILLFELVAGAVSALLLTHEIIDRREWIGGGLVVIAAYISARTQVADTQEA